MIKHYIHNKKQRLVDLQGVLFKLIELSEEESEREFYEVLIEKTNKKIKEYTKWFSFLTQKEMSSMLCQKR